MAIGNFVPSINSLPASQPSSAPSNFLNNLQSRLIVQRTDSFSIGGFKMDYDGEARVQNQADVTDHYAEDNTVINDHVAMKPVRLTLRGLVAELSLTSAQAAGILGGLQNGLTTIPAYLQHYTPGAVKTLSKAISQAQAIQNKVNQAIAEAQNVVSLFSDAVPATTRQQQAYAQLSSLQTTRQLLTVVTPFDIFKNMIIEDLTMSQPEASKYESEIIVVLKQLRFVDVIQIPNFLSQFGGRAAFQNQPQTNLGLTPGTQKDTSILASYFLK